MSTIRGQCGRGVIDLQGETNVKSIGLELEYTNIVPILFDGLTRSRNKSRARSRGRYNVRNATAQVAPNVDKSKYLVNGFVLLDKGLHNEYLPDGLMFELRYASDTAMRGSVTRNVLSRVKDEDWHIGYMMPWDSTDIPNVIMPHNISKYHGETCLEVIVLCKDMKGFDPPTIIAMMRDSVNAHLKVIFEQGDAKSSRNCTTNEKCNYSMAILDEEVGLTRDNKKVPLRVAGLIREKDMPFRVAVQATFGFSVEHVPRIISNIVKPSSIVKSTQSERVEGHKQMLLDCIEKSNIDRDRAALFTKPDVKKEVKNAVLVLSYILLCMHLHAYDYTVERIRENREKRRKKRRINGKLAEYFKWLLSGGVDVTAPPRLYRSVLKRTKSSSLFIPRQTPLEILKSESLELSELSEEGNYGEIPGKVSQFINEYDNLSVEWYLGTIRGIMLGKCVLPPLSGRSSTFGCDYKGMGFNDEKDNVRYFKTNYTDVFNYDKGVRDVFIELRTQVIGIPLTTSTLNYKKKKKKKKKPGSYLKYLTVCYNRAKGEESASSKKRKRPPPALPLQNKRTLINASNLTPDKKRSKKFDLTNATSEPPPPSPPSPQ